MVGDVEELDKSALPGLGPIRIRVACKDPRKSRVLLWHFLKKGFKVFWLVESEKTKRARSVAKRTLKTERKMMRRKERTNQITTIQFSRNLETRIAKIQAYHLSLQSKEGGEASKHRS